MPGKILLACNNRVAMPFLAEAIADCFDVRLRVVRRQQLQRLRDNLAKQQSKVRDISKEPLAGGATDTQVNPAPLEFAESRL